MDTAIDSYNIGYTIEQNTQRVKSRQTTTIYLWGDLNHSPEPLDQPYPQLRSRSDKNGALVMHEP